MIRFGITATAGLLIAVAASPVALADPPVDPPGPDPTIATLPSFPA